MHYDHQLNLEDSDDDLFKGNFPNDFQEIAEETCQKCAENEKKLSSKNSGKTITMKEFKPIRRALYKKIVDSGVLKYIVEKLSSLSPTKIEDLQLLKRDENTYLDQRFEAVTKIANEIKRLYGGLDQKIPLSNRLASITEEAIEMRRKRNEEIKRRKEDLSDENVDDKLSNIECNGVSGWCGEENDCICDYKQNEKIN